MSEYDSVYSLNTEEEDDNYSSVSDHFDTEEDFDLYGEFNRLELDETICDSTTNILALSGPRIFALNPYEIAKIVDYDFKMEKEFLTYTNSLHSLLHVCDKIVAIVHIAHSRDHVFEASSERTSTSGLEVVLRKGDGVRVRVSNNAIPTQDGKIFLEHLFHLKQTRFVVSHFIIHISDFANNILRAVERLELARGSNNTVVKDSIQQALANLDKCDDHVAKLDTTLKDIFQSDHLKKLQEDLGCYTCPKELSDALEEVDALEKKQRESHVAIKCQQGKLINFNNLISATQKHLPRSHDNVEAKERRVAALGETIALIKKTIEKVPASASTTEYLEWLYWWTTKGSKEVEKNANLNGTEVIQYYDSLIFVRTKGRVESVIGVRNEKKQKEIVLKDLKELYRVYSSQYKKAKAQLDSLNETFKLEMGKCQNKIGRLRKKIAEIKTQQPDYALFQHFLCHQRFIKSIENRDARGVSAFSPLFEILSGIRTAVRTDVELLSSDDKRDIFVAGKRLRKQAAFLLNYSESLMYL